MAVKIALAFLFFNFVSGIPDFNKLGNCPNKELLVGNDVKGEYILQACEDPLKLYEIQVFLNTGVTEDGCKEKVKAEQLLHTMLKTTTLNSSADPCKKYYCDQKLDLIFKGCYKIQVNATTNKNSEQYEYYQYINNTLTKEDIENSKPIVKFQQNIVNKSEPYTWAWDSNIIPINNYSMQMCCKNSTEYCVDMTLSCTKNNTYQIVCESPMGADDKDKCRYSLVHLDPWTNGMFKQLKEETFVPGSVSSSHVLLITGVSIGVLCLFVVIVLTLRCLHRRNRTFFDTRFQRRGRSGAEDAVQRL